MLKSLSLQNIFSSARPHNAFAKKFAFEEREKPFLAYALIAVNAILLLSYLLGVNTRASTGYEIKQMQVHIQELNEDQKALSLKLSQATAISALSQDFSQNGFVEAGAPSFITLPQAPQNTAMK